MSQRTSAYNYLGEALSEEGKAEYQRTGKIPVKAAISTTEQVDTQEKRIINGMEFVSIQNEVERFYDVPNKERRGETIRVVIKEPQWLFVRSSGAHQVITPDGFTHYIPNSFVHLAWKQKEGTDAAEF